MEIMDFLKNKSFLLLLDDLWQPVEFADLGIPQLPQNGTTKQKVVFTIRLEGVFWQMQARPNMKVQFKTGRVFVNGGGLSQSISNFMSYCLAVPLGGADSVFDILDLASEMDHGFGEQSNSGSGIPEISHFR